MYLFEKKSPGSNFSVAGNLKSEGGINQKTPHYLFSNSGKLEGGGEININSLHITPLAGYTK